MNRVEPNRNVYVGHRYVPLLVGEWDKSIQYEGLSIVTFKGGSYTSKKMTPPGIDIENEEYWVLTGNYDAQVEYYRQDVQRVKEDMSELDDRVTKDLSDTRSYIDDEVRKNREYVDSSVQDLTIYVNDETASARQYVDDETTSSRQYVNDEVEGLNKQLSQTMGLSDDLEIPIDENMTISDMYPNVTINDVKEVDENADLSDSADWFYLQSTINKHKAHYYNVTGFKRIKINQKRYRLSRTLDLSNLGNCEVDMRGCEIAPFDNYSGYLVSMLEGWGHTTTVGLFIRGEYQANGLNIDSVQHFNFTDLIVEYCRTGLRLSRTYYGSFNGQSKIADCITSVLFDGSKIEGTQYEVNTINFYNLDVTSVKNEKHFDGFGIDYNADTYGFLIKSHTLGVKTNGVTIENSKKAFYIDDTDQQVFGRFSINNCYFEAIHKHIFEQKATRGGSRLELDIQSPLLNFKNEDAFVFTQGTITLKNVKSSGTPFKVILNEGNGYRPITLYTDVQKDYVINNSNANATRVFYEGDSSDLYNWDVYSYSDDLSGFNHNPPAKKVVIPQTQNNMGYYGVSHDRTFNSFYKDIHSPSQIDLVFNDTSKGIVLKDRETNDYYRLKVENGILGVEKDGDVAGLMNKSEYKPISFFLNTQDSQYSDMFYSKINQNNKLIVDNGTWKQRETRNNTYQVAIGSIEQIINANYPENTYSSIVYNKDIDVLYTWESSYWGWGARTGKGNQTRTQKRAVGTTTQRPTDIFDGFIYYDITINDYVRWDGEEWTSHSV